MKIRTITVAMLLIAVLGTMLVMPATAATATRTLPSDCVNAGEDFTVTIEAYDYGSFGAVIETLCADWEYQSTTADDVQVDGNTISFLLLGSGPKTFTYTVSAPDDIGACCDISGIIRDDDTQDYTVTGATEVCVCIDPGEPTATRTLPSDCVNASENFTVTIETDNYGSFGAVIETLCAGWEYQSTTADDVQVDGNTISFLLLGSGPKTFTYTVSAPDDIGACCDISGIIRDDDTQDYTVTGATEVCVCIDPGEPTATRTLPSDCVNASENFTVTIETDNYGSFGAVIETLCAGWEYQSTTADDVQVDGNTISFLLLGSGPKTFTYTVSAPDDTGACCDISGIIRDDDTQDYTVTGATEVCVCIDPGEPTATRTLPGDCVNAGEDFTVTIEADNYGSFGAVIETLCADWEYQSTTADDVQVDGNTISFLLLGSGPKTFTYTVSAPDDIGACCDISGIIRDDDTQDYTVTGATEVCVCSVEPTATRTLPGDCVNAGEDFTVTIEADNYGSFGAVIETLCADWEYQSTTADDVQVDGNTISFLLVGSGPKTFTYTVSAPDATGTCCNISGIIRDDDTHDYTVTGATEVCVCEPTATRTLPSDCVIAGAEFTVAITADNYGSVGAVIEVICDGWTYQNTTADDAILIDANTISFPLTESGPSTFTYTVLAPNAPDSCCVIGGILRDETGANHGVTGDCEVCTCTELNWWDEWMGPDSEEGSTVTTTELQAAIHHWLEDIPVRGHVMSTPDFQWIIAEWLSG